MRRWIWGALVIALLMCSGSADAQELSVLGGVSREDGPGEWSDGWGFS